MQAVVSNAHRRMRPCVSVSTQGQLTTYSDQAESVQDKSCVRNRTKNGSTHNSREKMWKGDTVKHQDITELSRRWKNIRFLTHLFDF